MAFTHGKKARLWIDAYELTSYFQEFQMQGKAGVAETTVFGLGAKTFIGGILEGQITAKGFFGSATTDTVDAELSAALGRQVNMAVTFSPTGATAAGTRVVVAYAAETDYQVSAPVTGVVATQMTAQADSGLSTGVMLYDPTTVALATATTTSGTGVNDTGVTDSPTTTVAVASNGVNVSTYAGAGVLTVATNGAIPFSTSGFLSVATSAGTAILTYTGTTVSTFTGVTLVTGTGTLSTGGAIQTPYSTNQGLVLNLHVFTLTGTGTPTVQVVLQHSDDNTTWVTLASGVAQTAVGGSTTVVAYGTTIFRYLRVQIVTAGSTISTTLGVSAARQ